MEKKKKKEFVSQVEKGQSDKRKIPWNGKFYSHGWEIKFPLPLWFSSLQ